ncbi:MAG TPA: tRNA 2-thiouridine(34) synthase MnmA [Acidimicrobiales bacterium]|nr:tRNA 2-thiouridine(34) synthase MnmA [Acidimicrobiales bacterium]
MRVLVAMSGGVDSSVAASLLLDRHEVVGATMKLWGGVSDSGCCSVADVEDARRVAQQLGITHHVFNFTADFDERVVVPYVEAHAAGRTPNPCIECNRHIKFDRFMVRAAQLGFDAVATGHHARVVRRGDAFALRRAVDPAKDQSYVLSMLGQRQLAHLLLPVGEMTKDDVRAEASRLGLRTASKPDSQDVCFIRRGGREVFLGDRIPLHPGRLVDTAGNLVGEVPAVELVTVGQRRGLPGGARARRYALDVDVDTRTVVVGAEDELAVPAITLTDVTWAGGPLADGTEVDVQTSAHGRPQPAVWVAGSLRGALRRVAPGQTVALYRGDEVVGAGLAA